MSGQATAQGGTDRTERSWRMLYVLGAVVALVSVAGSLFDIVLTMMPGWGAGSVPTTAVMWFAQFDNTPLLSLRNLDLLNVTMSVVTLPLYVALFGAQRRSEPAMAALALGVVGLGTALFVANNAALPMLELSRHYALAAPGSERLALEGAAQALLARGAHGSLGALPGFFLSSAGTLLMTIAMVRGRVFARVVSWIGVAGAAVLTAYTVGIAIAPHATALVMAVAMPGGLLMIAWSFMVARALLRMGRATATD